MPFQKGRKKTGGRAKGVQNLATTEIKEMIHTALSNVGGVYYLQEQALINPVAFMGLIKAILPKDVNVGGQADNELVIKIRGAKIGN
mgnify:CR=1 FL=1